MFSRESSYQRTFSSLCVLALLTSFTVGYAQTPFTGPSIIGSTPATASLAGTVVDENDAVISEASVLVKTTPGRIFKQSKTNPIGLFTITDLPAGSYTVAVQHEGFATAEVRNLSL